MHARPGKEKETRGERLAEKYGPDCTALELPPVDNVECVVRYLFEVGPTSGDNSVSWHDLAAWQQCTGVELDEFSAGAIVHLSRVYLGMLHEARENDCLPPYQREKTAAEKAEAGRLLQAKLRAGRS